MCCTRSKPEARSRFGGGWRDGRQATLRARRALEPAEALWGEEQGPRLAGMPHLQMALTFSLTRVALALHRGRSWKALFPMSH